MKAGSLRSTAAFEAPVSDQLIGFRGKGLGF